MGPNNVFSDSNGAAVEESAACTWLHRKKVLYLQPHYLNSVPKGVGDAMNATINKYQADLGGIVLRHKNARLLSVDGSITDEESLIKLVVEADFEVFRPVTGCTLRGVVNKVSGNHVSCLVFEVFNISCPRGLTREGDWMGDQACLGQEITCQVDKVDLLSRLPYIRAEITELHEMDHHGADYQEEEEEEEIKEEDESEEEEKVQVKCEEESEEEEDEEEEEDVKPDLEFLERFGPRSKKKVQVEEVEIKEEEMSDDSEKAKRKKRRKSKNADLEDHDVPLVAVKQEVFSDDSESGTSQKVKKDKSLKRKRKSKVEVEDGESPKKKKKKRKTFGGDDGRDYYLDSDGCPVLV